jgi:hypothetical protein
VVLRCVPGAHWRCPAETFIKCAGGRHRSDLEEAAHHDNNRLAYKMALRLLRMLV